MVRLGLKATHKCYRVEGGLLSLKRFKEQYQHQTVLVATDKSTVVACINKQGGTHGGDVHSPFENDLLPSM